jgi:hypothetical protein
MVDHTAIHVWTWDARPYPQFPLMTEVWSDGANWERGHWLTGRMGALTAEALVAAILADYGVTADAGELDGVVDGFLIGEPTSARGALEPLSQLLAFEAFEAGDTFAVVRRGRRPNVTFTANDLVEDRDKPVLAIRRAEELDLPAEIGIGFTDPLADYRPTAVSSRRLVGGSRRAVTTDTGAVLSYAVASGLADTMLQDTWAGREAVSLVLPQRALALEPADVVTLDVDGDARTLLVTRIEDAGLRRIEARTIDPDVLSATPVTATRTLTPPVAVTGVRPEVTLLDLPLLTGTEPGYAPRVAAFVTPWPGAIALSIGTAATGFAPRQILERRAVMGELTEALPLGPVARWDRANSISVRLYGGAIAGEPELAVLNGANAAAIGTAETGFEVVQFATATLVGPRTWRLEGLLRGQAGPGDVMAAGHDAGARFVLLDRAVVPLDLSAAESALGLTLRAGAARAVYDPDTFVDVPIIAARRGLKCLAPVHAQAVRDTGGDVTITWIRQTRIGGDAWEPVEVPLGETSEAYRLAIYDGVTLRRTLAVTEPRAVYSAAMQAADFGAPPSTISISINQVSPTDGLGFTLTGVLNV